MLSNDSKYYVYAHVNPKSGCVFYVGKGTGDRCRRSGDRSRWWKNYVKKHGFEHLILCSGLTEDESYEREVMFINLFKSSGVKLVNLTDGGEGSYGREAKNKKSVCNTDGKIFESIADAAEHMSKTGWPNANAANISKAASSVKSILCYGESWWFYGEERKKKPDAAESRGRVVCNSSGERFESCYHAAEYLRGKGWPKAYGSAIAACARGNAAMKSTYGYSWWWEGDVPKEYISPSQRRSEKAKNRKKGKDGRWIKN